MVTAQRAGHSSAWHPECFNCSSCSELLVDLLYFYGEGKLSCGRHHAETIKPRCDDCDEVSTRPFPLFWHWTQVFWDICCSECKQWVRDERDYSHWQLRGGHLRGQLKGETMLPHCWTCQPDTKLYQIGWWDLSIPLFKFGARTWSVHKITSNKALYHESVTGSVLTDVFFPPTPFQSLWSGTDSVPI